jgi:hypothetical protein
LNSVVLCVIFFKRLVLLAARFYHDVIYCLFFQVLDEADKLLNVEFEKALDDILKEIPKDRRTFLFSATMTKKSLWLLWFNYVILRME